VNTTEEEFGFLSIGDIVSDAFIRLKDASLHCDINHEHCQICMDFGSKLPYESVTEVAAVGNSPNAAVAASRLGLHSALVTELGNDHHGQLAIETLEREKVSTRFVRRHDGKITNYHYVLWFDDDRTILIKHEEYPYTLPEIGRPEWIYLSSLGEHSAEYHKIISDYLMREQTVKLAFQPGTFQMKLGYEALADIYKRTEVFLCNTNEAQKILGTEEKDVKILLKNIGALGPKIVIITDGPRGAYAYDSTNNNEMWFMPPYPDPKPPLERTGAGDSFSATLVAAFALGKSLETALRWAPINSMSVVQQVGAQAGLLTRPKLEEFLANAPEDYRAKAI